MTRLALGIEYDGSQFYGWQAQKNLPTVQAALEKALSTVAGHPVKVVCAGRTDTGVHATGQVAHVDVEVNRTHRSWSFGTNASLEKGARLVWVKEVSDTFHARYSALKRHYRYVIYNHSIRPSLFQKQVTWICRPLNECMMHEAAQSWVGEHDFTSFRASACQSKTSIRELTNIHIQRKGELLVADFSANAFLHHMIRNMMGVLIEIGMGKTPVSWSRELLEAKNRSLGGITAAPNGLYLRAVDYPEVFDLPKAHDWPWIFNI